MYGIFTYFPGQPPQYRSMYASPRMISVCHKSCQPQLTPCSSRLASFHRTFRTTWNEECLRKAVATIGKDGAQVWSIGSKRTGAPNGKIPPPKLCPGSFPATWVPDSLWNVRMFWPNWSGSLGWQTRPTFGASFSMTEATTGSAVRF